MLILYQWKQPGLNFDPQMPLKWVSEQGRPEEGASAAPPCPEENLNLLLSRAGSCRSLPPAAWRFGELWGRIRGTERNISFPFPTPPHPPSEGTKAQQQTEQRRGPGSRRTEGRSCFQRQAPGGSGSCRLCSHIQVPRSELGSSSPAGPGRGTGAAQGRCLHLLHQGLE